MIAALLLKEAISKIQIARFSSHFWGWFDVGQTCRRDTGTGNGTQCSFRNAYATIILIN